MHAWEAVETWKPRRRGYHRRGQERSWRTKWKCAKCGIIREMNHITGLRHPDTTLDAPPPDFKVVKDQGKTVLSCGDMVVKEIMES